MWILIVLFFASLIFIIALFGRVYWKLKTGMRTIGVDDTSWIHIRPDTIRNELQEHGRYYLHRLVLLFLKIWIRSAYCIRKYEQIMRNKVTYFLHMNAQKMSEGRTRPVSKFLKHISDNKQTRTTDDEKLVN